MIAKKRIILLGIFIATLGVHNMNAQKANLGFKSLEHHFGIVAGGNISRSSEAESPLKNRTTLGFQVGGKYELNMANGLFMDVSTLFIMKSFKHDSYFTKAYQKRTMYNIDIPVHLGYKYKINKSTSVLASFGPYLGVGLWGHWKQRMETTGYKQKYVEQTINLYKKTSQDSRFDMGVGCKIGIELYQRIQVLLSYNWGLTNLNREFNQLKHRNGQLAIAYLF